jgi:transcriptional regulator with XRE-family HTH domain
MPRVSRLKTLLAEQGRTQRELAERLGIAAGTVSLLANGRLEPWPKIRRRIAAELGEDPFDSDAADRLVEQAVDQGHGRTVTDPDALRTIAGLVHRTSSGDQ